MAARIIDSEKATTQSAAAALLASVATLSSPASTSTFTSVPPSTKTVGTPPPGAARSSAARSRTSPHLNACNATIAATSAAAKYRFVSSATFGIASGVRAIVSSPVSSRTMAAMRPMVTPLPPSARPPLAGSVGDVNSARRRHRRPRPAAAPSIATRNPVKVAFISGQKLWRYPARAMGALVAQHPPLTTLR